MNLAPTVALQDGVWHHVHSYAPERAQRTDTVALWHKIRTVETPEWTQRYHTDDPAQRAFGGRVLVRFANGSAIEDEIDFPPHTSSKSQAVPPPGLLRQVPQSCRRNRAGFRAGAFPPPDWEAAAPFPQQSARPDGLRSAGGPADPDALRDLRRSPAGFSPETETCRPRPPPRRNRLKEFAHAQCHAAS